jgi:cytochrome c553
MTFTDLARLAARLLAATPACVLALAPLRAQAPHAQTPLDTTFAVPAWAFPVLGAGKVPAVLGKDTSERVTLPTSRATFSIGHARNAFDIADWNPATHGSAPPIVTHGRRPAVMACGFCHLADGRGRPENAMVAGLPHDYIVQQIRDMRSRARGSASPVPFAPSVGMRLIADSLTDAELEEAARYFSGVRARRMSRVVEADVVPKTMALNGLYTRLAGNETERLGTRIIEYPLELRRHELHDPMARYVAYVPRGSLARGRTLAKAGAGAAKSCESCHGPGLHGLTTAPPLAGRSPTYMMRQLVGLRTGARNGANAALMREEAAALTLEDMIAAAAYAGSLEP